MCVCVSGGGGGAGGNLGVILVRVCEPVFQNLPHSYTWPLKKTDPLIYLIIQNVDLFIYCPLIFVPIFCWLLDKYHSQFIEYQENKQPRKISERNIVHIPGCQKNGAFHSPPPPPPPTPSSEVCVCVLKSDI